MQSAGNISMSESSDQFLKRESEYSFKGSLYLNKSVNIVLRGISDKLSV